MAWGRFSEYVSADARRNLAEQAKARLRRSGKELAPVLLDGPKIAHTFWGKAWCQHLESFSDYATRLPRGRSYVRSGCILHLDVASGLVEALVQGSATYDVRIQVDRLSEGAFKELAQRCAGQVTSLVELLSGAFSDGVMAVVTDRERGLFPNPGEIELSCDCPDHASMCKHVAAVLYGIGARLDREPALLFTLRGVDAAELVTQSVARTVAKVRATRAKTLPHEQLATIFGIELDFGEPVLEEKPTRRPRPARPLGRRGR